MGNINEKLDKLRSLLQDSDFLTGKGLSNEVNIRMFCYDPEDEMTVRHFIKQLEKEIMYYNLRHTVKPGLTGWAQVMYPYGASIEDAYRKLQYDLYYIKNHDILFDVKILLKTITIVIFGKGR